MGLDEKVKLVLILLLPISFLSILFLLKPAYYVEEYEIKIESLKTGINVSERMKFLINKEGFRELYRSYSRSGPQKDMIVYKIECPEGFKAKRYEREEIELACRKNRIEPGTYEIGFSYFIPKAYACNEKCVLNWLILDHFDSEIEKVRIYLTGKNVATIPKSFKVKNWYETFLAKGMPLRVYAEFEKGHKSYTNEIQRKPSEIYSYFMLLLNLIFKNSKEFMLLLSILISIYLLLLYLKTSVEIEEMRTEVLHYFPKKRSAAEVDFLFGKKAGELDENVIEATIMELIMKNKLKFERGKLYIKGEGDTEYEKMVIAFLREISEAGVVSKESVKKAIRKKPEIVMNYYNSLKYPPAELREKLKEIFDFEPRKKAVVFLSALLIISLVLILLGLLFFDYFARLGLILLIPPFLYLISLQLFDDYVFGRYTREGIKERYEWEAFRNLLENQSLIEKYHPGDLNMWGYWLIYATLFGCAKNVIKAMEKLGIELPEVKEFSKSGWWVGIKKGITPPRASGSHVGFGSGFGGGGGGAR